MAVSTPHFLHLLLPLATLILLLLLPHAVATSSYTSPTRPTCPCLCRTGPKASKAAYIECNKPIFSSCVPSSCTRPESTRGYQCCTPLISTPPPPPPQPPTLCPCTCRSGPMAEMSARNECEAPARVGLCAAQSCSTPGKRYAFYCCDTPQAPPSPPPSTQPPPADFCPCSCRTDVNAGDSAIAECQKPGVPARCVARQCAHGDGTSGFSCCDQLDVPEEPVEPPTGTGDGCPCTCYAGGPNDFGTALEECDTDGLSEKCGVGKCATDGGASSGYSCCGIGAPPPPPATTSPPVTSLPASGVHGDNCPCSCYEGGDEGFARASNECDAMGSAIGCVLDLCTDADGEKGVSCCAAATLPDEPPTHASSCPCTCHSGEGDARGKAVEECSSLAAVSGCDLFSCNGADGSEGISCCGAAPPPSPSPSPSSTPSPSKPVSGCPCACYPGGWEAFEKVWKICDATNPFDKCEVDVCTDNSENEGVTCCAHETPVSQETVNCPCTCRVGGFSAFEAAWNECDSVSGCEIVKCATNEWEKGYSCCRRPSSGGGGNSRNDNGGRVHGGGSVNHGHGGRIFIGRDGRDGRDGRNGFGGFDGEDGEDGEDGY